MVDFWRICLWIHSDYWSSCRVVGWTGGWSWRWEECQGGDFEVGLLVRQVWVVGWVVGCRRGDRVVGSGKM